MKIIILIVAAFALAGCKEVELLGKPDVIYKVESTDTGKDILPSAKILVARLNEYRESPVSEIILDPREEGLFLKFRHGSPDEELIKTFASTIGKFEGKLLNEEPTLFTNADILSASTAIKNDRIFIITKLTPEAGQHLHAMMTSHPEGIFIIYLDTKELISSRFGEPLGESFTIPFMSVDKARFISTLMKNKSLDTKLLVQKVSK